MGNKAIPQYVLHNSGERRSRKWKSIKRKQAREARAALRKLQAGCAYFPSGTDDVTAALEAVDRVITDVSIQRWGN